MIYKSPSPIPGHVRITFELPSCLWADRIFLVGDFNQWEQNTTPMRQERDGVWRAVVDLEYGKQCEFRYLIDGQWRTDYHADGAAGNSFGTENSLVQAVLPEDTGVVERLSSRVREGIGYATLTPSAPAVATSLKRERRRRTTYAPARAA